MILVTGAAGYIGAQVVHTLNRYYDQPKMIGVDNLSAGYTCNLPHGFECFMGDVGHAEFMGNLIDRYKVKQIVHCAASVVVPESVEQPMAYYANNTIKTFDLLRVAIAKKVEGFVFASTAAVYGEPDLLGAQRGVREDDWTRPTSPYGTSKLMTEQMLRDIYVAHGMNTVVLRFFNVAGADPLCVTGQTSPNATHLVTQAVRAAVLGRPFKIYGDGKQVRDYIHVADVAEAVTRSLEWTARHNGVLTLNVGSGIGHSVQQVLETVTFVSKKHFPIVAAQPREGDPRSIVADTKLIRARFNWEPQYDLNAIVEHAIKWEKTL